ncbi:hypothetical protein B0I35DRAFT_425950 [Stachybotrys elegans]|uniref:Signal peptidase complex catalytic subunit SEC11 n=1 Tax=Stachybotrys elegans TaxID=80388 RepID=A0A8K0WT78_9HYPO|nr:hypothetical protein B0I35DRAFT_425950 [Stachybotrys elegans]
MSDLSSSRWELRPALWSILPFLQVLSAFLMGYKALSLLTNTPNPLMIVTTGSMEPAFQIGDILLIVNHQRHAVEIGDIPVCQLSNRPFPMVHRVIKVLHQEAGAEPERHRQLILTKGDNNELDDTALYPDGQMFLHRHQIVGFVRGSIPFLGWIVMIVQNPLYLLHLWNVAWLGQRMEENVLTVAMGEQPMVQ